MEIYQKRAQNDATALYICIYHTHTRTRSYWQYKSLPFMHLYWCLFGAL